MKLYKKETCHPTVQPWAFHCKRQCFFTPYITHDLIDIPISNYKDINTRTPTRFISHIMGNNTYVYLKFNQCV